MCFPNAIRVIDSSHNVCDTTTAFIIILTIQEGRLFNFPPILSIRRYASAHSMNNLIVLLCVTPSRFTSREYLPSRAASTASGTPLNRTFILQFLKPLLCPILWILFQSLRRRRRSIKPRIRKGYIVDEFDLFPMSIRIISAPPENWLTLPFNIIFLLNEMFKHQ